MERFIGCGGLVAIIVGLNLLAFQGYLSRELSVLMMFSGMIGMLLSRQPHLTKFERPTDKPHPRFWGENARLEGAGILLLISSPRVASTAGYAIMSYIDPLASVVVLGSISVVSAYLVAISTLHIIAEGQRLLTRYELRPKAS